MTWLTSPAPPPSRLFFSPVLFLNSMQKFYWMRFWLTQNVIIERVCLGVCVCVLWLCCNDFPQIWNQCSFVCMVSCTKGHRNVGGQMWYWHSNQVSGKGLHAHTHLFLSLFMWQAKAPAGGTHSTLYSLRTRDCGGRERRKGGEREAGERKRHRWKHSSSEMCSWATKYKEKWRKVFIEQMDRHSGQFNNFCFICTIFTESFVTKSFVGTVNGA